MSLHRYAILLAFCTLLLVAAGATVTTKEAGLSVPDWPLSYGKVMPPMEGGVFFEHGHRMIATTVGLLTIGLVIFAAKADKRAWLKRLTWLALLAVIVQGLLGGITVLTLLPPLVSTAHACLAQLFFALTVAIAVFTSPSWNEGPELVSDYGFPSLRSMAIICPASVFVQVFLGAAFRHRAMGVLPHVVWAMLVALIVLLAGAFTLNQLPNHKALKKPAVTLLVITFAQVFLGMYAYLLRAQNSTTTPAVLVGVVAHVATGALTLAASIVLSIQIRRNVTPKVAA